MSTIVGHDAKRFPFANGEDGAGLILLTVLTARTEGTYKAYAAIVQDISRTNPDYSTLTKWVQEHGNPLPYAEANAIWPMIEREYAR